MRKLLLAVMVLALVGCKYESKEQTANYNLPPALKQCRVFKIDGENAAMMRVVVCPNSSTTTTWTNGKVTESASVVYQGDTI